MAGWKCWQIGKGLMSKWGAVEMYFFDRALFRNWDSPSKKGNNLTVVALSWDLWDLGLNSIFFWFSLRNGLGFSQKSNFSVLAKIPLDILKPDSVHLPLPSSVFLSCRFSFHLLGKGKKKSLRFVLMQSRNMFYISTFAGQGINFLSSSG